VTLQAMLADAFRLRNWALLSGSRRPPGLKLLEHGTNAA
jgi:hypothetical protein